MKISSLLFSLFVVLLSVTAAVQAHGEEDYAHCDDVPNTNVTVTDQGSCVIACEANNLYCRPVNGNLGCGANTYQNNTIPFTCECGPSGLPTTIVCQGFGDQDDDDDETSGGWKTTTTMGPYYLATALTAVLGAMLS